MIDPIVLEGFSFAYKRAQRWALRDIDATVGEGEFLAVVGPSGAGKSTLAAAIGAFIPGLIRGRIEGVLTVEGKNTADLSPRDLAGIVGTVFQDFESQIFSSRVDIETAFGPENLGLPHEEIVRRVNRSLKSVSLIDKKGRIPSDLSGGEKQRLVIASILAMDPRILVFDEPVTDLDPEGQYQVLELLERLLDEKGHTVVLIDHESGHLTRADRIAVMAGGQIAALGTPEKIFRDTNLLKKYRLKQPAHVEILSALGIAEPSLAISEAVGQVKGLNRAFDEGAVEQIRAADREREARLGAPIIEIEGLSYSYGKNRALSDINLVIREREFAALIGPNGSGKTTLVKQINGLLSPAGGSVLLSGRPPRDYGVRGLSEMIGLVHQNPDRMIFSERVFDEAAFGLTVRGVPARMVQEKVSEVLTVVGLLDKADDDPFLLTKGERQRLAVAATLAVGPRVLILDEPTTGLDYGEIVDMMNLLSSLNDRGHTVICITHNMDVVARYCRRMIVLVGGKVAADGPTREVFSRDDVLERGRIVPPPEVVMSRAQGFVTLSPGEFIRGMGKR